MTVSSAAAAHSRFLPTALAGASATFSGIGLGRFAYVPLFPAMVTAGWVTGAEAGMLGALNLAGYLGGVVGGRTVARRIGTAPTLTAGMLLAALSFLACGWNGGGTWLAVWRGLAGVAGGLLMVIAGPAVQGAIAAERRGLAGGIVIMGVAMGAVTAAVGVPVFLGYGIATTWIAMAVLVGCLLALTATAWPNTPVAAPTTVSVDGAWTLAALYGLSGAGLVPHMVYFVDLVVRGRGLDLGQGSLAWLLFGAGGLVGPLLGGRVCDRLGARRTLQIWLAVQVAAVGLALVHAGWALFAAAFLGGFAAFGCTAVALSRTRELAGPGAGAVWAQTTGTFALAQAVTGLVMAAVFAKSGSHDLLFGAALVLSALALVVSLTVGREVPA